MDLSDLFDNIQLVSAGMTNGSFQFSVTNAISGRTSYIQSSSNLIDWVTIQTTRPTSSIMTFTDTQPASLGQLFYRIQHVP